MQLNPYLSFNGQCEAAFKFYEKCLGGKIVMMMRYGESPLAAQTPAELQQRVLHLTFALGNQTLAGADAPPERYQKPQGFSVTIDLEDGSEAERIFAALAENGVVQMPVQVDALGAAIWHGRRSVRHAVDDQLQPSDVMRRQRVKDCFRARSSVGL